jgi:uncharacterized glyoxalase superfamily protein PhnB
MLGVQSISPLITVAKIEPCLEFWTHALGFELTATVPEDPALLGTDAAAGAPLGFAMLQAGDLTVMLQSGGSLDRDLPGLSDEVVPSNAMLFIKVDALDPFLPRLAGLDVVHERRTTFYGMDEIFVRSPCGTIVGLAAPVE